MIRLILFELFIFFSVLKIRRYFALFISIDPLIRRQNNELYNYKQAERFY